MAYANVQNSGLVRTNAGGGLSWTPGAAPTLNNLLTGRFWGWNSGGGYTPVGTDVKDSSGTPKNYALDSSGTVTAGLNVAIHSLLVPSGLTTPLKNLNGAANLVGIFDEWSGNATTTILDVANSNRNTSAVFSGTSGTLTTSANCGLVLACVVPGVAGASVGISTTGTSFTANAVEQDNNTWGAGSADSRTATTASQTGLQDSWSWTAASGAYVACIASYNQSTGGFDPTTVPLQPQDTLPYLANLVGGY